MNRRRQIIIFLLIVLFCVLSFLYFQTPKLETNKITQLTISSLPSPPMQKTITRKEDIQKFVDYFNSLYLFPNLSVSVPSGTSVWVKTSGNLYTHQITVTGDIIQFDRRNYQSTKDISAELRELYRSMDYPETQKVE